MKSRLSKQELFEFLEEKAERYNRPSFIESDPVCVPHLFVKKEDIEIAGFLTATISWGQRPAIIDHAKKLLQLMDFSPYDFVTNSTKGDLNLLRNFRHRTFNGTDCMYFVRALKNIYTGYCGMENVFGHTNDIKTSLILFRKIFFTLSHPARTEKHVSHAAKNSSSKRLNMFLRWMVRKDNQGVDFGIWKKIYPSQLMCPLDIHSGNVARKLGLLKRKHNDWKAVEELTINLRKFDPADPVKYDFALFGLGIFERF